MRAITWSCSDTPSVDIFQVFVQIYEQVAIQQRSDNLIEYDALIKQIKTQSLDVPDDRTRGMEIACS